MTTEKLNSPDDKNSIRLNKLLAERGLASRRGADKLIAEGQVTVNGKRVYELGIRVNPFKDRIVVDGAPDALAAGIAQLLSAPDLLEKMSLNGSAVVARQYGWDTVAQQMEAVYQALLIDRPWRKVA